LALELLQPAFHKIALGSHRGSTLFTAAAARCAAFSAEVLHWSISMGDPLSKVASD
jgi:hypothetical protein